MAKKTEKIRRSKVSGIYLDEITQEQIDAIIARNPKAATIFETIKK